MKFGMTMHVSPPNLMDDQTFKELKNQDGGRQQPS